MPGPLLPRWGRHRQACSRRLRVGPTGTRAWQDPCAANGTPGRPARSFVVESGLQNHEVIAVNEVDQPVLLADPPRPGTREHVAERFGFADPGRGVAQRVVDQAVGPVEGGPVT